MHDAQDKLYKLSKAAERLSVSPQTLRRWLACGKLPYTKSPTGRIFLSAAWVEAYIHKASPSTASHAEQRKV